MRGTVLRSSPPWARRLTREATEFVALFWPLDVLNPTFGASLSYAAVYGTEEGALGRTAAPSSSRSLPRYLAASLGRELLSAGLAALQAALAAAALRWRFLRGTGRLLDQPRGELVEIRHAAHLARLSASYAIRCRVRSCGVGSAGATAREMSDGAAQRTVRMTATRSTGLIVVMAALAVGAVTAGAVAIAEPGATSSQADNTPKPVLIETALSVSEGAPPTGTVRRLFIGQRSLCTRARFEDEARGGAVIKRIDCGRRGDLTIRFMPRPNARNQSSSWTLIEATGSFRRLRGGGTMFVRFEQDAPRARETFTGTLR